MFQATKNSNTGQSWVLGLVFVNIIIFLLQILIPNFYNIRIEELLGLNPLSVFKNFWLWQVFTYMFLHSPVNFLHIFFNMYLLWVFGSAVEAEWGSRKFLYYYLFSGIGAGLSILVLNFFTNPYSTTIGASGSIFALLLAFGILFPNTEILLFFILPVKAKYLVLIYGILEFYLMLSPSQSNISHVGHLGGIFFGFIYFLIFNRQYLPFFRKTQKSTKIIGEIRKKVEKIKDKTTRQAQKETIKNGGFIKQKIHSQKNEKLSNNEKKFINALLAPLTNGAENNICRQEDFSTNDSYCLKCELFNRCLHRDITGKEPKQG